jgi:PAS domain S-box-containing protein
VATAEGCKVLVIDDEAVMRDGCRAILSREGCEVITAADGEHGLVALRQDSDGIEVILLDLKMPGIGGMEVLDHIGEINPNIPVIVITGYATVDSAVEAMKKGAYDFVPKPFTPDELWLVVLRALEKKRLEREAARLAEEAARSLRDVATEKGKVRTIVHSMAEGVLVTDEEGRVVLTNPAAGRLLGCDAEACLQRPVASVARDTRLVDAIRGVLMPEHPGVTSVSQELKVGESLIRAHVAAVRSEEEEILGTVSVLEDMSYLLDLDRMKTDFIAMVSHELRAPIAAIGQNVNLILDGIAGDITEKQRHLLTRVKERAAGLTDLVTDLLEMSKIEVGAAVQRKEPMQVDELVQRVVDLMEAEAMAKKVSVHLSTDPDLSPVLGDPDNLERVFTNLVDNAIKYNVEGGSVEIAVSRSGDFIKVSIQDTGIGISEDDLPRLFDRFYRVKSEKTRGIVGTGLGLSIVKNTVEAHLGSITITSGTGGTTVIVLLPIHRS